MSDEITLKIKKDDLWKYSTFVLLAVVVIGAIIMFTGNGSNNYAANTGNNNAQASAGTGDFSFTENRDLYAAIGPESASVKVIEFFDFQCPYCALAAGLSPEAAPYATQYSDIFGVEGKVRDLAKAGKIQFVFGLHSFLGDESGYAGEAALCANEQGKYPEMYDAIFEAHNMKENDGKYSKDNLKILAKSISGISTSKFNSCLDSGKYSTTVSQMATAASTAGVSGTPSFIINGQAASGSWTEISSKLQALGVKLN